MCVCVCALCRSVSDTKELVYPGSPLSTLGTFLSLLWTYLDGRDTKTFLGRFVLFLSSMYREVCVLRLPCLLVYWY